MGNSVMYQTAGEIIAIVFSCLCLVGLLIWLIILCYLEAKSIQRAKEYIKTLDEHDRAVVLDYKTAVAHDFNDLRKKKKNHEDNI